MRVRILREAHDDIKVGRQFYDSQEQGVGAYFSSTIYADIRSLRNFGGIHPKRHGYHMGGRVGKERAVGTATRPQENPIISCRPKSPLIEYVVRRVGIVGIRDK